LQQAHRAADGCHALLKVLAHELPTTGAPALSGMIDDLVAKSASLQNISSTWWQAQG
jgi:DNA polymerase-3 subunit epsilon